MKLISSKGIHIFTFLLFLGLSFSACEKDDTTSPLFQLLSIEIGDVYQSNEEIPVQIKISDNEALVSYKVVVRNLITNELEFVISETTDKSSIDISDVFMTEVAEETEFDIELTAEDNSGNIAEEKARFKVLPPEGGKLAMNFKLQYQDNPLVMFDYYDYVDDVRLYFTRFSFFISNIILVRADGSEKMIKEVDFVDLTNDHQNAADAAQGTTYAIPAIEEGEFVAIKFAIGIPDALNAMKPADFSFNHPLSRTGEYWVSWNSYIFMKTEGHIDRGTGDFDLGMALHTGSDEVYREKMVEFPIAITNNTTATIDFDIDLYDMLVQNNEAYDLVNNPGIHHLGQIDLAIQLADNLIQIIE